MVDMTRSAATAARRRRTMTLPDGTVVGLSALTLGDMVELRQEALARYKRDLLQTYTKNADLIPEDKRDAWLERAFSRAETITLETLPKIKYQLPILRDGKPVKNADGTLARAEREIDYPSWWGAETVEGKLFSAWLSMRAYPGQEHFTMAHVNELFREVAASLEEAAGAVADLTQPDLGN